MPVEIRLAKENPNDTTAEVVRWLVDDGQWINAGDEVVEVESSKAVMTVVSETEGYLKQMVAVADIVETGKPLALLYPTPEDLAGHAAPLHPESTASTGVDGVAGARFSASGRQELVRSGLDPQVFAGQGLITAQVVRDMAAHRDGNRDLAAPEIHRRPLTPSRQTEIDRLTAGAAALASSLTVGFESATLRAALLRRRPVQPSVLAVVIHGVARALREFPELNARFAGSHIECYRNVNVGVAVDCDHGLRVPVIKHADQLDAIETTFALLEVMATYQERRLSAEQVSRGTVTVSDLSGDDILQFQPRINKDQTLALGIGADATLTGHPMTITAVFDHRACTGRTVARFLGQLKAYLTDETQR